MLLKNCILHIFNIDNIICRKSFRPAYAQLGMLSALFSECAYSCTDSNSNGENKKYDYKFTRDGQSLQ